ncbi:MAG: hypothetical protein LBB78_08815 [Spirochaetaceae bacterium]|jgi:hypothetical protein|nr:hypothetical protein [Spirochaetaceae bacterium]
MADKLDWMNKHLVLLRHTTVEDTISEENYKIRPDLAVFFTGVSGVEEMVFKLARSGQYKDACELLAYVAHRRAGIWWGYRCVLSLIEELGVNPAVDVDIAGIGTNFEVTVPDFAKVPLPDPPDTSQMEAMLADVSAQTKAMRTKADPVVMKMVDDAMEVAFGEFKKIHGMHPLEMVKQLCAKLTEDPSAVDPASPVFVAKADLQAKLQALQKETVATIKSVIPPKVPEHEKKVRDNAMQAVYRWVVAPEEGNSKACLDTGNECPDTPAGLLSLSAFWAFGNLMPGGNQTVPTPPGLAANGLVQTLLMCALAKGGTRKLPERYEVYFNLGVDVLSGKDNWGESLVKGEPPHRHVPPAAAEKPPENSAGQHSGGYKRWKPENE